MIHLLQNYSRPYGFDGNFTHRKFTSMQNDKIGPYCNSVVNGSHVQCHQILGDGGVGGGDPTYLKVHAT